MGSNHPYADHRLLAGSRGRRDGGRSEIRQAVGEDDPERLPDWEYSPFGSGRQRTISSLVGTSNETVFREFAATYVVVWLFLGLLTVTLPGEYATLDAASPIVVVASTAGLFAYHAISYRRDFIGGREYERKGPVTLMVEPFYRVFVLIATMVLSGVAVAVAGSPAGLAIVFVVAKTYFDVQAHHREHQ